MWVVVDQVRIERSLVGLYRDVMNSKLDSIDINEVVNSIACSSSCHNTEFHDRDCTSKPSSQPTSHGSPDSLLAWPPFQP